MSIDYKELQDAKVILEMVRKHGKGPQNSDTGIRMVRKLTPNWNYHSPEALKIEDDIFRIHIKDVSEAALLVLRMYETVQPWVEEELLGIELLCDTADFTGKSTGRSCARRIKSHCWAIRKLFGVLK